MDKKLDSDFEKIENEIKHEQIELKHLKEEIIHEEQKIEGLEDKLEKIENKEHSEHHHKHHHKETIKLIFIVNGTPTDVHANRDWELKTASQAALKQTGNEGRALSDWNIKWNNKPLDENKKIEEYHFPECAELFLSLNAGQGG